MTSLSLPRDVLSVDSLRNVAETTLVDISPSRIDLDKMLAALGRRPISRAVVPLARRDLPTSSHSSRGSLRKPYLPRDPRYFEGAASRESRWKLWDLDPLPLIVRSVDATSGTCVLRVAGCSWFMGTYLGVLLVGP